MLSDCKNCEHGIISNYSESEWQHFFKVNGKERIQQECEPGCGCVNPKPKELTENLKFFTETDPVGRTVYKRLGE